MKTYTQLITQLNEHMDIYIPGHSEQDETRLMHNPSYYRTKREVLKTKYKQLRFMYYPSDQDLWLWDAFGVVHDKVLWHFRDMPDRDKHKPAGADTHHTMGLLTTKLHHSFPIEWEEKTKHTIGKDLLIALQDDKWAKEIQSILQ